MFSKTIVAFSIFCSIVAYSETFQMTTEATGMSKEDADTITELFKINFKNEFVPTHQLQSPGDLKPATYKLKIKILKMDGLYVISMEKEKEGASLFSASIKSPKADELDQKISRLVRAVINEEPIKDKVGEITSSEKVELNNRRQSVDRWYVGFGPSSGSNLGPTGTLTNLAIAYNWEVNSLASIRAFFDSVVDSDEGKNAQFSNFGLGLQYFLDGGNFTPYVQGDIGRASATNNANEKTSDFSYGAGVGYTLFRASSTNFDFLLRMQTITSSTSLGTPAVYSFRVGVLF